ncbi:uncharacterized protein PV06_03468 [Exophiala oligosperma]|uniref:WW domain-containing protein n=1 Tax=Exophiala oligosperma TaxID=215243 RepID=A0A0D2C5K6_9EURO|nr:uncharacterized protein PV06_03468 [Exophiala oligosperma]KIW45047.1 hypothetical protein PV06_03468 [Exophiala oligosperma]
MLKTTYRAAAPAPAESPLPPGWTEHKAPTGHTYYFNAETKQSTYTRPTAPSDEPLQIDYGASEPDHVMRASMQVMEEFQRNNPQGPGHFTGGKSYQDHSRRRGNQGDRPKSKAPIPDCFPWVVVKTKLGRRFVHNTETKQSLWKFPQDVMMAVIEMDKNEWEAKKRTEEQPAEPRDTQTQESSSKPRSTSPDQTQSKSGRAPTAPPEDYDSDSYEEVEVTDDEAEDQDGNHAKRPRLSATPPPSGPVEFNEDDIAWQLAAMEDDFPADDDAYSNPDVAAAAGYEDEAEGDDEEDEGLPLTDVDKTALFRSLLDDSGISPYSTFEKLIDDMNIVEDDRWVALPNTASRRDAFGSWSKDRIAEIQERKRTEASTKKPRDARVDYLRFLNGHATPKLYWPEFKRKFKREPEMRDAGLQDKDREKMYRELVAKLKTSDGDRKRDLVGLLKSAVDKASLERHQRGSSTSIDELPDSILRDVRFYTIEQSRRDELVKTFLET